MHQQHLTSVSVYNLKRRISELPAISEDQYNSTIATTVVTRKHISQRPVSSELKQSPTVFEPSGTAALQSPDDGQTYRYQCIFCLQASEDISSNLSHMYLEHGLHIPQQDDLCDLESLIDYLYTIITSYHECLYCGTTKGTSEATRRHMLDKGHCMINLEREPELLEFWNLSDDDTSRETERETGPCIEENEYILPSGKVIGSKNKARELRSSAREHAKQHYPSPIIHTSTEQNSLIRSQPQEDLTTANVVQDRSLTNRDARGLVGVSDQQVRALVTLERKMQRQQAVQVASNPWADELGGRSQKHSKQKMNLRAG